MYKNDCLSFSLTATDISSTDA